MKKKILSGVLAIVLAVAALPYAAMNISTAQAAEVENADKYYAQGIVCEGDNYYLELCVGDTVSVSTSVYKTKDNTAVEDEKWDFESDGAVIQMLKENGYSGESRLFYSANDNYEDLIPFEGAIPEEAFGKYVYALI